MGSTWLITTASALGPLIALSIGFAGTDRLLRWQLAQKHHRTPTKGAEGSERTDATGGQSVGFFTYKWPDRCGPASATTRIPNLRDRIGGRDI
jgi:hypothetical protein